MKFKALAALGAAALVVGTPLALTLLDEDTSEDANTAAATASEVVPEEYRDLVNQAGSICDEITPGIIASQLAHESTWDPTATSNMGAQGIAQFMPSTWASVGKDYSGDGTADVLDPADAIPTEGQYMCDQLAQVEDAVDAGELSADDDPVALTLAAYNTGLSNVVAAGGVPDNGETAEYVAGIIEDAASYETSGSATDGRTITASGDVQDALEWARGIAEDDSHQYVYGAEGPTNYDCSGLSQAFMSMLGVDLVHKADDQARDERGTVVESLDQAQPGDLIFWGDSSYYYHVAIYAGSNMMISADNPSLGINYEEVYGSPSVIRRFTSTH